MAVNGHLHLFKFYLSKTSNIDALSMAYISSRIYILWGAYCLAKDVNLQQLQLEM